ncbi:MAG: ferrous iron transporter B [Elusimicrobiota bacterium]|nr:ferrous iron transporter B [Endomicrobiia bacterium]MDW8165835.1 ferrous iron transporter B [Elusimicrobiota bacterium]
MKRILLFGNPNVGKSVLFSRLTGVDVIISNYPGTTVEFTKGYLKFENQTYEVIDVPGTYTLEPTTKAEEVAVKILEDNFKNKTEGFETIVINVIDATNLERNLNLTLQLINKKLPLLVALNFWDEVKHRGISINYQKLQEILDVPVVPICARSGEGIKELIKKLKYAKISNFNFNIKQKWEKIGNIIDSVQQTSHKHHTFLERLSEISIRPSTGLVLSIIILFLTFYITRLIGENLITHIFEPLFNNLYLPTIKKFITKITSSEILHNLLLGTTPQPMESFGILTTGLYIPFVVVLPYIIAFYLILGVLEDIGYLPRLAVILDRFIHKLGIHGYSFIPILLGFGCKVPGILATRILETQREKIIATVLVLILAPCIPQSAMIISLISPYGIKYIFITFIIIFLNGILISFLLNKLFKKTETPELFLEIPPYRIIHIPSLLKKLYIRIKQFLTDAVPLIFGGIILVNIFEISGINNLIVSIVGKIFMPVLGLPKEISSIIILGFLRKDVSIALLAPFKLNIHQLIVSSVFMTLYMPCISTLFSVIKEHGMMISFKIFLLMLIMSFILSFIIRNFLVITIPLL